jgi:hypothetical protein
VLGKLRHLLGESLHQGLTNVEGRKVDINELTISGERGVAGAQASPWQVYPPRSGSCGGEES